MTDIKEAVLCNEVQMPPKRFWAGPLGEHDDDWLAIWAWLVNRSKAAQATSILAFRIRTEKPKIKELLEYSAQKRGLSPDELMQLIIAGQKVPDPIDQDESDELEP